MKKFQVKIIVKTLEIYEVEAEDAEQAEANWAEGRLVRADDEVFDVDVDSVTEIP